MTMKAFTVVPEPPATTAERFNSGGGFRGGGFHEERLRSGTKMLAAMLTVVLMAVLAVVLNGEDKERHSRTLWSSW